MTSVTDAAAEGKTDEDREAADPFAGDRIEVSESALRNASPSAWLAGAKRRIDEAATRLTYGE